MKPGASLGGFGSRRAWATAAALIALAGTVSAQPNRTTPGPDEVKAMESLLAEHPAGVGKPITDRAAWEALGATKPYQAFIREAEKLLTRPLGEIPDDVYLEFSRTGKRDTWQNAENQRRRRLKPLVLAECIENRGRFLPAIESLVKALCAERTWVLPAHDRDLGDFRGEKITIDLWSSALAWNLATTDWLLGEKLSAAIRQEIRQNIRRRVLDPFRATFTGADASKGNWWVTAKHNWNSVCLAGVAGAAMQQIESRRQRAEFLAAAVKYSENYLKGYEEDGYCTEGLSYWNYGLGHYVLLAETISQATGGNIDLIDPPLVSEIARFALKIHIMDGVYPSFADCPVKTKPDHNLMYFVSRRWGLGLSQYNQPRADGGLAGTMIYAFNLADSAPQSAPATALAAPLRDWFGNNGILIARPAAGSACRMGVALKGGHNAETHNHNDVGSYVVAVGNKAVLLDAGSERYTARTFSPKRYESNVLNSFGHPVPIVAGQLQREGPKARAEILKTEFTDQADLLAMEIGSAYKAEGLKSLVRTFLYSRQGDGSLTVTDKVEFASPQSFGTALITGGSCKQTDNGELIVQSDNQAVKVTIDTGGEPFEVKIQQIKEDTAIQPTRIGIDLAKPVTAATIKVTIEPVKAEAE